MRALESAINQPRLTFDRTDLYPDILAKAAALCFFLVMNHPFVDGNKRVGHAAMDLWLDTAREFGRAIPEPKGRRLQYA